MNMKGTIKKKILGVLAIAGVLAVNVWAVGCRKNGNGNAGVSITVSTTDAGSAPKSGFSAEFRTEPSEVEAGKPTKLIIRIKKAKRAVVRDLALSHAKTLHFINAPTDFFQ